MKNNQSNETKINLNDVARELGYANAEELKEDLKSKKSQPLLEADPEELTELKDVRINTALSVSERIVSLLRQTKNPYCYRYNGMIVKTSFAGKGTIEECLTSCFFSD